MLKALHRVWFELYMFGWLVVAPIACGSSRQPPAPPAPAPVARRDAGPCVCPADAAPVLADAPVLVIDAITGVDAGPPPDAGPLPPLPSGHPRIMLGSQGGRLKQALAAGTPAASRWRTATTSWVAGADLWGFDAYNAALLGQLTGTASYCAKAIAVVDKQVADAEAKIAAGAAPEVAGDSYLGVGEMIGDVALVYDWCTYLTTAAQRARWISYANQAVWNVWHHGAASWGGKTMTWSGWAVDDPSNNYYYSFLRATMLLGLATKNENPQADVWLAQFRDKLTGQLVPTFNADLTGGGSREGTGYGIAMGGLWELYALWQWSTGEAIADLTPHTRASLPTMLHQIVPTLDRIAPTGDQSRDSTAAFFDYHRKYLLELLALYPGDPLAPGAAGLLAASSVTRMSSSFTSVYDFVYEPTVATGPIALPLVRYAPGIGEIYARTSWASPKATRRGGKRKLTSSATWLNVIAGPFTQSHAHEDQGSLMLYKGGWLAYDAVVDSKGGVRQSGSLVGTTAAHSLVRIDVGGAPVPQPTGTTSKVLALHVGPGYVFAAIDTTAAYRGAAAVTLVRRQVLWLQPDVVVVQDHVITAPASSQTWQLVTPMVPVITGAAAVITASGHTLTATRVQPSSGAWTVFDFRSNADFTGGWRLDQTQPGGDRTYVTVLAIDGATSSGADTAVFADVGVTFALGGKQVVLGQGVDQL